VASFYAARNIRIEGQWVTRGTEVDISGFRQGAVTSMLANGDLYVDSSGWVSSEDITSIVKLTQAEQEMVAGMPNTGGGGGRSADGGSGVVLVRPVPAPFGGT
jgi:hypothetical protein